MGTAYDEQVTERLSIRLDGHGKAFTRYRLNARGDYDAIANDAVCSLTGVAAGEFLYVDALTIEQAESLAETLLQAVKRRRDWLKWEGDRGTD